VGWCGGLVGGGEMGRKRGVGRKEGVEERALDVVEMLL